MPLQCSVHRAMFSLWNERLSTQSCYFLEHALPALPATSNIPLPATTYGRALSWPDYTCAYRGFQNRRGKPTRQVVGMPFRFKAREIYLRF